MSAASAPPSPVFDTTLGRWVCSDEHTVGDPWHSVADLYDHKRALTAFLTKMLSDMCRSDPMYDPRYRMPAPYRSKSHHPDDNPCFKGQFIVVFHLVLSCACGDKCDGRVVKQFSYHFDLSHWNEFDHLMTQPYADKYTGHTPESTVASLFAACKFH